MAETIPGGMYRGVDGLLHDANGKVIPEPTVEANPESGQPAEVEHADTPASPKKKK